MALPPVPDDWKPPLHARIFRAVGDLDQPMTLSVNDDMWGGSLNGAIHIKAYKPGGLYCDGLREDWSLWRGVNGHIQITVQGLFAGKFPASLRAALDEITSSDWPMELIPEGDIQEHFTRLREERAVDLKEMQEGVEQIREREAKRVEAEQKRKRQR